MFCSGWQLIRLLKPVHCKLLVLIRDPLKGRGGGMLPAAVENSYIPQESLIFDFSCRSPENPSTLHLEVVGITSTKKITITKNINLCN